MSEADSVLVERDGPVTIVSINRPHCRNAVDGATARKLYDAFLAFDADEAASVAVFTGTGGYFCAGADLKAVAAGDPNKKREIGGHDFDRADGAEPVAAVETCDRRGRGLCGGRRHGAGAVGRHARGRRRRHLRHLLPPLRRAADRSRHHPPAAADRPFAGDRPDPHRTSGRRAGGAAHGTSQSRRRQGRGLCACHPLAREIAHFPQNCLRADRLSALRQWDLSEEEAIANEMRGGLEVIASGETLSGATRFASGVGRHGAFASDGND